MYEPKLRPFRCWGSFRCSSNEPNSSNSRALSKQNRIKRNWKNLIRTSQMIRTLHGRVGDSLNGIDAQISGVFFHELQTRRQSSARLHLERPSDHRTPWQHALTSKLQTVAVSEISSGVLVTSWMAYVISSTMAAESTEEETCSNAFKHASLASTRLESSLWKDFEVMSLKRKADQCWTAFANLYRS